MKSLIICFKIDLFLVWLYSSLSLGISASTVSFPTDGIDIDGNVEWPCWTNATCTTPQSFCGIYHQCQCPTGYIFNAAMTACLEVATGYDDECVETSQCLAYLSIGGKCIKGVCNCDTGYHYLHGRCYKSSGLGEKCKNDDDCYVNWDSKALSCSNGICACSKGFYQREYRSCRREANAVGDECTIDLDCRFDKRARCDRTAECYLSLESVPNNVEDEMSNNLLYEPRMPRSYGSELLSDLNCTTVEDCAKYGYAICTATGRCICERGKFYSDEQNCISELGEKCDESSEAAIDNSKCRDGHWSCEGPRIASANNHLCRKAATMYNPNCKFDEQCYVYGPDSSCVNSTCVCNEKSHYVEDEMFCWINRGFGESCKIDKDCHVPNFRSKLICNNDSKCGCPKRTHLNSAGTGCADDVPVLGGLCSADDDCKSLANVYCHEERCSCIDAHFQASGACVAGINASCTADHDCKTQNSTCNEHVCICSDGLVSPSSDLCVPVSEFDGECQYDIQCSATITDARCLNPEVAKPVESKITGSSSLNGTCNCALGYHEKYKKCYSTRVLDETCHSRGECYVTSDPDSVQCLRGVCTCDFDAKRINSTFCQHDAAATIVISILLIPSMLFVTNLTS